MSLVQINWNPSKKDLRIFGICMIVGFAAIAGLLLWRGHRTAAAVCLVFGHVTGLIGLSGTKVALPIYWGWMAVALVMGNVISRVLLTVFYYLMITPMGLIMRLFGRDKLHLRRRNVDTYWVDAPAVSDKAQYERQF